VEIDNTADLLMEELPEQVPGQLSKLGGILGGHDAWHICQVAHRIVHYTNERLWEAGFQIVGNAQIVGQGDDLVLRMIAHYVGREEAMKTPSVWPNELPRGIISEDLDPDILSHLKNFWLANLEPLEVDWDVWLQWHREGGQEAS